MTYVISGFCCGLAGFLIACRLSGAGPGTGLNLEILALTAAVVGGNSLGGGRGSIAKGADGRDHRAGHDQRPDPPGLWHRHQPDGAGPDAGGGGDPRHPLAEEPPQGAERGLCRADLSPHGRDAVGGARAPARPMRSTTGWPKPTAIGLGELEGPEDVILDATIISIAARAMARSSASSRPTTSARKSSPISAAFRSASPSTATAICSAASAPWGSTRSRSRAR